MVDISIVFVLIFFMAIREVLSLLERRDLMNRIMSRDVADYKALTDKKKPKKETKSPVQIAYEKNSGK